MSGNTPVDAAYREGVRSFYDTFRYKPPDHYTPDERAAWIAGWNAAAKAEYYPTYVLKDQP